MSADVTPPLRPTFEPILFHRNELRRQDDLLARAGRCAPMIVVPGRAVDDDGLTTCTAPLNPTDRNCATEFGEQKFRSEAQTIATDPELNMRFRRWLVAVAVTAAA